jgi:hypothetical protein
MASTPHQRQLAAARQALEDHLRRCEICDLAVRERPGAELCVHGSSLASSVRRLAADRPAGRSLSIGDFGIVDED